MTEDCFHLGIKALIKNEDGEVLLLQVNPDLLSNDNRTYWDIPGGRITKGDNIEDTLKREIKEETGITNIKKVNPFSWTLSNLRIPVDDGDVGLILAIFTVELDSKPEIVLSNEHISFKWFKPNKAAELLTIKYPPEFVNKVKKL